LITLSSRSTGHCATSLQEGQGREIASCDKVEFTRRELYSRTIESEVGCIYQRGTTFVAPHIFPLDEGAPDAQHGRDEVGSALSALDCRWSTRPLGRCFAKGRCTVAVSAPYLLKEHPDGKSIKRKLSPKGGKPPQGYGGNLQRSHATSRGACAVCPGRQLANL